MNPSAKGRRMETHKLIDAQFYRAVEIVQGLPKTGPIQTGYEEKLAMYSLYKQATVGNVKAPRPGMWDMLGRAKWDAWAKQKDLDPQQAKWLYVETLLKVLRKYSDKTVARDFVRELEAYAGDPSNIVMSGSFAQSSNRERHSSSGSSRSASPSQNVISRARLPQQPSQFPPDESTDDEGDSSEEDEGPTNLGMATQGISASAVARPISSLSSHMRYRTPLGGASTGMPAAMSPSATPILSPHIPLVQPMPRYASDSAFSPSTPSASSPTIPPSTYPPTSISYPHNLAQNHSIYPSHPDYMPLPLNLPTSSQRPPLERAIESMQASLAALHERLESLESMSYTRLNPSSTHSRGGAPPHTFRGTPPTSWEWDPSNMGTWSIIFVPLTHLVQRAQAFAVFLSTNQQASTPLLAILRRLVLDVSFIAFVLFIARKAWRATGIRRREVLMALRGVWLAIMGSKERVMVDRGV